MTVAPHQIITGALNSGESAFAVGSVEGINFTACAVGCDIVILASDFQRVQIIPGSTTGYVQALCVDCCYETGKVAAAFYDLIRIYEPMALSSHTSQHKLDYQWFETCCFNVGSAVTNLSWNLEGLRLLVSTEKELQMFQHRALTEYYFCSGDDELGVEMGLGGERNANPIKFDLGDQNNHNNNDQQQQHPSPLMPSSIWECVWKNHLPSPLRYIKFSPDGTLFATAGANDNLVKIWYQDSGGGLDSSDVTFSFIYLAHPKPVVGFEWRKTGRYMPRGCVANVLITWCRDHICRVWCETSVPTEVASDMLLDLKSEKFPPRHGGGIGGGGLSAGVDEKDRQKHHRLKNARGKITHRLKHLKKMKKSGSPSKNKAGTPSSARVSVPSLSLVPSVSVLPESFDLPPVLHFHLAASICAETDCFLVPSLDSGSLSETTFAVHWLNNKELLFSLGAEKLLAEALAIEHPGGASGLWYNSPSPMVEHRTMSNSGNDKNSDDGSSTHSAGGDATAYASSRLTASSTVESVSALGSKDILDLKLEQLLREWQHSSDILFTIHPLDGSLLVWTMDYLDDCGRQPQVSFSSRLPGAFPMSDAASLNHNLAIFNPHDPIYVDLLRRAPDFLHSSSVGLFKAMAHASTDLPGQLCNTIFLLTTHRNGTLNLWHLNIDEKSKFCTILSIAHKSRMCGHRFRVSGISCHPVLPLFLTTSHHNIRRRKLQRKPADAGMHDSKNAPPASQDVQIFNSELILWKVNPVGPLCKSGGVRELARINSPDISAFSSVAWIPAILPSSTLGSISNSPSSCFVASDGRCLRVYQAVIDARALLAEVNYAKAQKARNGIMSNSSSAEGGLLSPVERSISDSCNIVSTQSTARPGCIIELDSISDASHDWKHIQLLHVFNEQMILGDQRTLLTPSANANPPLTPNAVLRQNFFSAEEASSVIDRTKSTTFHDRFYLVVLEKNKNEQGGAIIHMWLLGMASQAPQPVNGGSPRKSVGSMSPAEEHEHPGFYPTAENAAPLSTAKLFIYSKKVCTQLLPLPPGVKVVSACPAAGHLASSSLYPACRAPFLLTTACSDDRIRFWYVRMDTDDVFDGETKYKWTEWRTVSESHDSQLETDGKVFAVSSAFSGRFACSYDPSNSYDTGRSETINVEVAVYECESTGGIEWQQEDIIHLRNIAIPRGAHHHAEEYALPTVTPVEEFLTDHHNDKKYAGTLMPRVPSIPKLASTDLRRVVSEHTLVKQGSEYAAPQIVRLDWVSTEDGSQVLTVGIGSKIFLFAPVSADVAQQNVAIMKEMDSNPLHAKRQQLMRKASTIAQPVVKKLIRWVALRSIDLDSADGLPPLPLMLSWVREGILVVGMESEMRVYHQWNISSTSLHTDANHSTATGGLSRINESNSSNVGEHSTTTVVKFDFDQKKIAGMAQLALPPGSAATPLSTASFRPLRISPSHSMLDLAKKGRETTSASSATGRRGRDRKRGGSDDPIKKDDGASSAGSEVISIIRDEGLFEAARLATPLIPQYHPKQLMELLNAGKTRRVKAILLHVLRCIRENNVVYSDALARQASVHSDDMDAGRGHSLTRMKTELTPDDPKAFVEIDSIPPLPLHALMAADSSSGGSEKDSGVSMGKGPGYDELFGAQPTEDQLDIDWGEDDEDGDDENADGTSLGRSSSLKRRRQSVSSADMVATAVFGAKHARMLSKLLTHIQLPGLSSVDQMHLLAVADTLSSFSSDAIDRLAQANASLKTPVGAAQTSEGAGYAMAGGGIDSVDECGLRFLMAMKQHEYLLRCLPLKQRAHLKAAGLPSSHIIWALHSETENELLNTLSCMQKGTPRWQELRAVGIGWWLKSTATLRQLVEKVAKAAFQAQNDPMDAAVFYLAMKKKNLLTHLYKSAKDAKMSDFFAQDFSLDKWKKAALKNAFILMGKQRFAHAVAFFLLGDSLNDALQVCVSNLNDLQLALVIVRLYEADGDKQQSLTRRLLRKNVIGTRDDPMVAMPKTESTVSFGSSIESNDQSEQERGIGGAVADSIDPVADPFLRSMAYWLLKDYHRSAMVLLEQSDAYVFVETESNTAGGGAGSSTSRYTISDVFNFYVYLRMHPLVVRQRLNAAGVNIGSTERFLQVAKAMESQITPVERKLYFKTASTHFKSGCALLALEVLCKLPKNICVVPPTFDDEGGGGGGATRTGKVSEGRKFSIGQTAKIPEIVVKKEEPQRATDFDWASSTVENGVSNSKRFAEEPLELKWDEDGGGEDEEDEDGVGGLMMKPGDKKSTSAEERKTESLSRQRSSVGEKSLDATTSGGQYKLDIMAQQLKFIACLKILMEELATLASGYEIDGGQLRVQLYHWLEREVEVLKRMCDYNVGVNMDSSMMLGGEGGTGDDPNAAGLMDDDPQHPVLLHVALRSDRASLTAKYSHAYRRRRWLAMNQQLLRTLIAYCSLHSSQGVGLASARMELLLLLQELHQEPTAQKTLLSSPIPLQSSFPLLAASVASIKTDIAGPLRYLHCQISDLLKSFAQLRTPELGEESLTKVYMFYNLSQSLSACIYDSLWEVESLPQTKGGGSTLTGAGSGVLIRRRRHTSSMGEPELAVTSPPNKWPGVENLLAWLSRERDEDVPNLLLLLAESWVAVYLAMFAYALTAYDSRWLYRLAAHPVDGNMFSAVFGGGGERRVAASLSSDPDRSPRPARPPPPKSQMSRDGSPNPLSIDYLATAADPSKIRAKFNAKVFGQGPAPPTTTTANGPSIGSQSSQSQLVATLKQWVPPKKSIVAYFVARPSVTEAEHAAGVDYDSEASVDESDTELDMEDDSSSIGGGTTKEKVAEPSYHDDPNSYAWAILRLALVRQAILRLQQFLAVCGLEYGELGATSPLIHRCIKTLEDWRRYAESVLETFAYGCPPHFLPDMSLDIAASSAGPSVRKYRVLLEPDNTPFTSSGRTALPVKRLWLYLVRQEYMTDIFIRYIFRTKKPGAPDGTNDSVAMHGTANGLPSSSVAEPLKIIQREQDPITSFAVSQAHTGWLVLSTGREIQEMDLSNIFTSNADWMSDTTELDLAMFEMKKDPLRDNDDYVLITPEKRESAISSSRGTAFLCKRPVSGVRRMEAHPHLPYYVSGANDGSVRLWEWGVGQPLFTPRASGQYQKVTKTRFNAQGNKFGITDGDGNVCLWQISHGMSMKKPYLNFGCHTKSAADFVFIGNSSSLLATAGYSSGDVNIALWDSLLPAHKALVQSWSCHPEGATCLAYAPMLQALLSAGRHGEVCIWDVRQRQLRQTLKVFDHTPVKCMALDPAQEFFAVGSGDGDIKIWSLAAVPHLLYNFPGEHAARGGFSLRQVGSGQVQGVQHMWIDSYQRLYSCGADSTLKMRVLPSQTQEPHVM